MGILYLKVSNLGAKEYFFAIISTVFLSLAETVLSAR